MQDYEEITNLDKESIVIKFYKMERSLWNRGFHLAAKVIWRLIYLMFSCQIPPTAQLADGVNIAHGVGIVIHQNARIGKGTQIYQNVTIGGGQGPIIGENCLISAGACIIGDVVVGNGVKIGANAVVLKDVPDNATVVGVPGRIVKIGDKRIEED